MANSPKFGSRDNGCLAETGTMQCTGMQRGMCTPAMRPKAFEAAMQKPTTLTGSSSPLMSRIRTPLAPKP